MTQSDDGTDVKYNATDNKTDGSATVTVANVEAKGSRDGLDGAKNLPIPAASQDALVKAMGATPGKYTLTFTYDANGLQSVSAATE